MGTKNNPGKFDCYEKALPDEPMFILLARDPYFQTLVFKWAEKRRFDINCGERPESDLTLVSEAVQCAVTGAVWRKTNYGIWRK